MMEIETQKRFRKLLFNEVSLALSIATAVFFLLNYVNNPVTKMQLDIALMQKDIKNISDQHTTYSQNVAHRDDAVVELSKKIDKLITVLETKGIIE